MTTGPAVATPRIHLILLGLWIPGSLASRETDLPAPRNDAEGQRMTQYKLERRGWRQDVLKTGWKENCDRC